MKAAAKYIEEHTHDIIDLWEEKVNKEISASETTNSMVLRNLLPNLLEDISTVLKRNEGKKNFLKEENCSEIVKKKHRPWEAPRYVFPLYGQANYKGVHCS
ncbi:hypothetical protein RM545_13040 [Zunongwangia sp. F260]|uniref:Uncharacterized protein n=1 Tax=Autumnicola lenta TaxID=3075593 RepID=A0ABU3CMP9_9FLAO|nr:hypothetical protein [Zunongwangia sp. F260]MDT0647619.1 hypothetical protein [Zunongwangia sp. F260]